MVLAIKKNTYGVRGTGLAFAIYSCPQNSYFVVFFLHQRQLTYSKQILIFPFDFVSWFAELIFFPIFLFDHSNYLPVISGNTWKGGEKKKKENVLTMLSELMVSFFVFINSDFLCEFVSNYSILKVFESVNV